MVLGRGSDLTDRVAGIVLAGGQGTRLYPLTKTRCKPAVGFGGRYRLIDIPLSNALNSKISSLYVISQYFAAELNQHIIATYRTDLFQKGGIELLCPEELGDKKVFFEGTADAVRKNWHHLSKSPAEYFLILSGDQLYNIDLADLVQFAMDKNADMVIASLYVGKTEAQRMGLMHVDQTLHVKDFKEKPKEKAVLERYAIQVEGKDRYLASMGIYVFRREALEAILKETGHDFGHHLIPTEVAKGSTYAYLYDGYWVDIGTIASFYEANMSLLDQKHCLETYNEATPIYTRPHNLPSPLLIDTKVNRSFISQGSIIEAAEIDHSILGIRCRVGKGTKIRHSILMGHQTYSAPPHQSPPLPRNFTIGENCIVEKAIIDEHTCIGNNVRLLNKKKLETYDGDNGVCIRDGIIIVTSGAHLPDDFTL
jgi:glucose-1-phosphate adenylyltransferase